MSDKIKRWKELARETVFHKYGRKIEKVIFRLPDGKEADYYLKKEGPVVCALPLTANNQIILVKQYRPGPDEILLELPGGKLEEGESPNQAMEREFLEETGHRGKIIHIGQAHDCAYSTMNRHCFVIKECEKIAEQKLDETEFAEVIYLSLEEFREVLKSGKMTDVEVGYLGLDFLNLL